MTGKRYALIKADDWEALVDEDGEVVSEHHHVDLSTILRAVGAPPVPSVWLSDKQSQKLSDRGAIGDVASFDAKLLREVKRRIAAARREEVSS